MIEPTSIKLKYIQWRSNQAKGRVGFFKLFIYLFDKKLKEKLLKKYLIK